MIFCGVIWVVCALLWAGCCGREVESNDAEGAVFCALFSVAWATAGVLALTGVFGA